MTNQQASNVVAMLVAGFPNQALEQESVIIWIQEIALLHDNVVAVDAARKCIREGDHFPSIKEFRQVYRSVNEAKKAAQPALLEPTWDRQVPEWVQVWYWLRRVKLEDRNLPQQIGHAVPDGVYQPVFMTEDEYDAYREEWVMAGSPGVKNAALMAKAMTGLVGRT